ncbi:MAG: LCP family protein [Acidimicrobiales bacterium]
MGQDPVDRAHRTWPQRLVIALNVVLILLALTAAGGLGYVYSRSTDIRRVELGTVLADDAVAPGQPENYLIIGVDNAPPGEPGYRPDLGSSERSDTIMVIRIDPESEQALLLSFPRDLYARIPGVGRDRINAAIQYGGPELLVATIEEGYGVPIHHFVSVNLEGFKQLVDLVGGIPVYFPEPARDDRSGLDVPEAGCVVLGPEQALAYARSRAYQALRDGRWQVDGTGDLGRISRQQHFIRRALETAISHGARNPLVLRHLIDAGISSVRLDEELTVDDLVDLGRRFGDFNPDTLTMHSLPVVDDVVGGAAVLRLVERHAEPVLDAFRGAPGEDLTPTGVQVAVLNGTGQSGAASAAVAELEAVGFEVPPGTTGDAERFDFPGTVVRYEPGFEAHAALVASHLAAGASMQPVDDLDAGPVVVVVGTDWAGVLATPREAAPIVAAPIDPAEPSTTSVVGEVPEAPAEVDC